MGAADQTVNSGTQAAEKALQKALVTIARRMNSLLIKLNTDDGILLRDQGKQLLALDKEVRALLKSRGVKPVLNELVLNLRSTLEATLDDHESLGDFTPEIMEQILDVFEPQAQEVINTIVDGGTDEVIDAVTRAIATGQPVDSLSDKVAKALDTTQNKATTAVNRALRELNEATVKRMGAAQPDPFFYVYVGPPATSPNIRPYCARRTGKALTQKAADTLDPKKRFNCRHSLAPVPEALVKAQKMEVFDE